MIANYNTLAKSRDQNRRGSEQLLPVRITLPFLLGQLLQQCQTSKNPLWQENECQIINFNEKSNKPRCGEVTCQQN
jgi:hypothetical protein